jgi:hypothetical protein
MQNKNKNKKISKELINVEKRLAKVAKKTKTNAKRIAKRTKKPTKQKMKKNNLNDLLSNHYVKCLLNPFLYNEGKIPQSGLHGPTFSYKRTYLTSFNPNASGAAFIYFSPTSIGSDSANASCLLIDNGSTYDPSTGTTVAIAPQSVSASLGYGSSADIKSFMLVSSGIKIYFENPGTILNPKGRVYAMGESEVQGYSMNTTATYSTQQAEHTMSYVISSLQHREFKNNNYKSIEAVYKPVHHTDFDFASFLTQSFCNQLTLSEEQEYTFLFVDFDASTKIYVEIHNIYEITPDLNGKYRTFVEQNPCSEDPRKIITKLNMNPKLFLRENDIEDKEHRHLIGTAMSTLKAKPDIQYNPNKGGGVW